MDVTTICVCGAGTMGAGIAQLSATAGYKTILFDLAPAMLGRAATAISKNLDYLVGKNKLAIGEKENILQHIQFTSDINSCIAGLVIEAISEVLEHKISLFQQLEKLNGQDCVFATNTSSLSIADIATHVARPDRIAGMHFFNPAPVMKLVEVVNAPQTSQQTTDMIISVAKKLGKMPVVCKDSPGFIVNRVARPYYIESLRLVEEHIADFEMIDDLLESTGFKLGPFRLMDLIGNDINFSVSTQIYEQLNKPERLKPSYIQQQKVERGELGKKTGSGYYNYRSNSDN